MLLGLDKSKASCTKCYVSGFCLLFVLHKQTRRGKYLAGGESGNKVLKIHGIFFFLCLMIVRQLPCKTGAALEQLGRCPQAPRAASGVSLIKVSNLP